jgi:hypothetical protein
MVYVCCPIYCTDFGIGAMHVLESALACQIWDPDHASLEIISKLILQRSHLQRLRPCKKGQQLSQIHYWQPREMTGFRPGLAGSLAPLDMTGTLPGHPLSGAFPGCSDWFIGTLDLTGTMCTWQPSGVAHSRPGPTGL